MWNDSFHISCVFTFPGAVCGEEGSVSHRYLDCIYLEARSTEQTIILNSNTLHSE